MLFLFLDTETTSLTLNGQIIELAATLCELQQLETSQNSQQENPNFVISKSPKILENSKLLDLKKITISQLKNEQNYENEKDLNLIHCENQQDSKNVTKLQKKSFLEKIQNKTWEFGFQKLAKFETLVRLRHQMDSKTARITGIDQAILQNAPNLEKSQENWQIWLEQELKKWENCQKNKTEIENFGENLIQKTNSDLENNQSQRDEESNQNKINSRKLVIVGHSLDFDLTFLRHEKWFLPEFVKIDTLEITKIFLPEMEAVNLEFLVKKLDLITKYELELFTEKFENLQKILENTKLLNLEQRLKTESKTEIKNINLKNDKFTEFNSPKVKKLNQTENINESKSFHRALFDAECCQNLLEFLLNKIAQNQVPEAIKNLWETKLENFLPREIIIVLSKSGEFFDNLENMFESKNKSENQKNWEIHKDWQSLNQSWEIVENNSSKECKSQEKSQIWGSQHKGFGNLIENYLTQNKKTENLVEIHKILIKSTKNLEILKQKFLKIEKNENFKLEKNEEMEETIIDLEGQNSSSLDEKIAIWSQNVTLETLDKMLNQKLPREINLLVLQIIWIAVEYQKLSQKTLIHQKKLKKSENSSKSSQENSLLKNILFTKNSILKLHTQREYLTIAELWIEKNF